MQAVAIYWDAATGNWFTASNWNPTQVPQPTGGGYSGDDVFINNAGTATADSSTAPAGEIVAGRSITVGGGDAGGDLRGSLDSNGVDIEASFGINIGFATAGTATADGSISVNDANLTTGSSINIGAISNATILATANGTVTLSGGDVFAAGGINLGTISGNSTDPTIVLDGMATGSMTVNGNVTGGVTAGRNFANSATSVAEGMLTITNGDLMLRTFDSITAGQTIGGLSSGAGGVASGTVVVADGVINLSQAGTFTSLNAGIASANASGARASGVIRTLGMAMGGGSFDNFIVGFASADGVADGSFVSGSGDVAIRGDLAVGQTGILNNTGAPIATGLADFGTGSIVGVNNAAGQFSVGNTQNFGLFSDGLGQAAGELSANGISGFDIYKIGVAEGTNLETGNRAVGAMRIGAGGIRGIVDPISGTRESDLYVGATLGSPNNQQIFGPGGEASGSVSVENGNIIDMRSINVGASRSLLGTNGSGNGAATGSLAVSNGSVNAEGLVVGFAELNNSTASRAADASASAVGSFDMNNGSLNLQKDSVGSIVNTATLWIGYGRSFGSSDPSVPVNTNPVSAQGTVNLTDVTVVGNANLFLGNAVNAFAERDTSASGTLNIERGSVEVGSISMGLASGVGSIARANLNLVDTSLTVNDDVSIGSGGDARGIVTSSNTNIGIGGDLSIGAFRQVIGTVEVAATQGSMIMSNGLLDVGGNLAVGGQFQGGNGELLLDNVAGSVGGSLQLARSSNFGTLFGNGVVAMNSSSLDIAESARLDTGLLSLRDSHMSVSGDLSTEFFNSTTMTYVDGASGDTSIELHRSLLDVGGEFALGIDDLLYLSIDGTGRGSEYGAIDAATANLLGGSLAVDIGFALTEDNYVFDLITSSSSDGILGDFASLDVTGYYPGYLLFAGIVLDDVGLGLGPTEIYRLSLERIDAVPVPAAVWLFGTALIGLAGFSKRRKSA